MLNINKAIYELHERLKDKKNKEDEKKMEDDKEKEEGKKKLKKIAIKKREPQRL